MIETERLILRGWRDSDIAPFHAMGNDPEVMRYLGSPLSRSDAEQAAARQNGFLASHGHCFWALERRQDGEFVGFCGLKPGPEGTPVHDKMEIGWRLRRDSWRRGYAREAAVASLAWGWANTDAPEVMAMTVIGNTASWGLMERLGMTRDPADDFDHPALPPGSPLRRHILYRIARPGPIARPGSP